MSASFQSRIAMLEASYHAFFSADNHVKKNLSEGIFWLVDSIEEEIRKNDYPLQRKCLAELGDLKDIAEDSFKDPAHWAGMEKFSSLCSKVFMALPDQSS